MDAKPILDNWLSEQDYQRLGQAVADGYQACDQLMSDNTIFTHFGVGMDHRSHLIRLYVEYFLNNIPNDSAGFFSEIKPNSIKNCWHVRLYKQGLTLTSHFMGRHNYRSSARPAINRAIMAGQNEDLFADEANTIDISDDNQRAYCHIIHGGSGKPEYSILAIPNRDQKSYDATCKLHCPIPHLPKIEEVSDQILMRLKQQTNALNTK